MRYVILRDDDTNAMMSPDSLERLYRPFLTKRQPVNLSVIPEVRTDVRLKDGRPEVYLRAVAPPKQSVMRMQDGAPMTQYLLANSGYCIAQHGLRHEFVEGQSEFNQCNLPDIVSRIETGTSILLDAGLPRPTTFVAPQDRFTRVSLREVARRFQCVSSNWFQPHCLPFTWKPSYCLQQKIHRQRDGQQHFHIASTVFLCHTGYLLTRARLKDDILGLVKETIRRRKLTVLITHWWEFFPDGQPDAEMIHILHEVSEYLHDQSDIRVISFDEVVQEWSIWGRRFR